MKFWNKICAIILFFLLFCIHLQAQNKINPKLAYTSPLLNNKFIVHPADLYFDIKPEIKKNVEEIKPILSANFSCANYSFFCREELKVEKATRLPLRFRLGSLEQCNYYEGKK
ncbi:MAG: hypothetical protein ABIY62_02270 [Ginsengibacter sp.]